LFLISRHEETMLVGPLVRPLVVPHDEIVRPLVGPPDEILRNLLTWKTGYVAIASRREEGRHGPQKSQRRFSASGIWENSGNHFLWLLLFHKKCEPKNLTHSFEDITLLCTIPVTSGFQMT
jgi:hypothetical protein